MNPEKSLIALTALALLISFIIVLTHNETTCQFLTEGGSWHLCQDSQVLACNTPAVGVQANVAIVNKTAEFNLTCPWRDQTSMTSHISYLFSVLFLFAYLLSPKLRPFNTATLIVVIGGFALIALAASFVMMTVDIIDGYQSISDGPKTKAVEFSTTQAIYIGDAVMTFLSFMGVLILTIFGFRTYRSKGSGALLYEDDHAQAFYTSP